MTVTETVADLARDARNASKRARRLGELAPLGINPETGKRFINTGRSPGSGAATRLVNTNSFAPAPDLAGRFRSRRERSAELRERMRAFSGIYNAGYMLRDSFFGPDARRREKCEALLRVFGEELRRSDDYEAALYALADAITASPLGCPWEP